MTTHHTKLQGSGRACRFAIAADPVYCSTKMSQQYSSTIDTMIFISLCLYTCNLSPLVRAARCYFALRGLTKALAG